jgi:NitT/TauT family transport system ATP-binding protein
MWQIDPDEGCHRPRASVARDRQSWRRGGHRTYKECRNGIPERDLLPWRTIRDNVLLPFEIIRPHRHKLRAERTYYVGLVQRLLITVGLAGFSEKYSWQLSGGMQQRANLCRAIVHQPSLLMLDEPFASLDAFTREELWFVMQQLWMDRKFTAILVTHDLREAVLLADRVIVFSQRPGRIVYETDVVLPRPRTLETTYLPLFTDLVHDLREKIRPGPPS